MSADDPLVSVIIPTIGRPHLVPRAVRSALAQTLHAIEVIVVVDGPDEATLGVLQPLADPRLRVLALPEWVGLGGARNAGIHAARSRWVALLDDDDEWLPRKLEVQVRAAEESAHPSPIVSCRFIDRRPHGDVVLPERVPETDEPLSEYLFCLRRGQGVILPSTVLTARRLLEQVPFRHARFAHEGSDWLLRAAGDETVGIVFVPTLEPLVIRHPDTIQSRMSDTGDWLMFLDWAKDNSRLLTGRAHAAFILIWASLQARHARAGRAFWRLIWESFRRGRPTVRSLAAHLVIWLVPERARFALGSLIRRGVRPPAAT
jgi:glycosyltransferase involved in cell wall biosynthesis